MTTNRKSFTRFFKEPILGLLKFKMAESAIVKIVKSPFLNEKSSDFDEVWYTTTYLELDDSHVTKNDFFTIQDGGHRHIENRVWP